MRPGAGALREFASFYRPHLGLFTLDMFCALLIALVDILFPVVTRRVLYDYIPNQAVRTFTLVMLLMLLAYGVRLAAQWIVAYLGHLMGVYIEADMRAAIFAHMQTLGFSFYDKNRTGLLMSRVTTDLFDITELAHHGPEDLFISMVTLLGSLIVLWNIQKTLALVLIIAVPLIVVFVVLAQAPDDERFARGQAAHGGHQRRRLRAPFPASAWPRPLATRGRKSANLRAARINMLRPAKAIIRSWPAFFPARIS